MAPLDRADTKQATAVFEPNRQVNPADAPEHWVEAERLAPEPGLTRRDRRHRDRGRQRPGGGRATVVPIQRESAAVAVTVAAASAVVGGAAWYGLDRLGLYTGAWTAMVVALLIAVPVRLSSRAEPAPRALAAIGAYALVVLTVLMVLTHRDLVAIYGGVDDYRTYEESLVRSRLQAPTHLLAYGSGSVIAIVVASFRRR